MEGENGSPEKSMWAHRKLADRETHFYYDITDTIITECVKRGVGTLMVSWSEDMRESDWSKTGNKKLYDGRSTTSSSTSHTRARYMVSRC